MNSANPACHRITDALLAMAVLLIVTAFPAPLVAAVQLSSETARSFDQYVRSVESRSDKDLKAGKNFLWIDALPESQKSHAYQQLQQGQILVRRECDSSGCNSIPGGLIHDWTGLILVPGVSLHQVLAVLQNYGQDARYYRPQVLESRLLRKSGDDFQVFLRLKQVEVITVVLDTRYDIHYVRLDGVHAYSRSYSTRIEEVENPGKPQEHDDPPGKDHGFLWRLDSFWNFYEADSGVYIQCRAISLTRNIPTGIGWLIGSFIEKIPADSLRATLSETRTALLNTFQTKKENAQ